MIHDRAKATQPEGLVVTAANYHLWVAHWFMTAEAIAEEFSDAGLIKTHDAVKDIIAEQRKYCK